MSNYVGSARLALPVDALARQALHCYITMPDERLYEENPFGYRKNADFSPKAKKFLF